jgi:serine/threonine protein kinase
MGEVYRARDPRLNRDVAIKVLHASVATDPERLRRFNSEAQAILLSGRRPFGGDSAVETRPARTSGAPNTATARRRSSARRRPL